MTSATQSFFNAMRVDTKLPSCSCIYAPGSDVFQQRVSCLSGGILRERKHRTLRTRPENYSKKMNTSCLQDDSGGNGTGSKPRSDALAALDRQLDMLAQKNGSATRQSSILVEEALPIAEPRQEGELPKGSAGFVVFLGIGLMVLTVVSNFLFTTYIDTEPSTRPDKPPLDLSWRRSRTAPAPADSS